MALDHLDQAQKELTRQIQAAYEARAFLRQMDPTEVLPGGPLQEQCVLQMQTLISAHACLSRAAEALYDDLTRFDAQMQAASDGDYTSMIEVRQEARGLTTVKEAGSKGGASTTLRHGSAYFVGIGKRGGRALKEQRGLAYYGDLGKKGGTKTKETYGSDHFSAMGKKGGAALKAKRGPDFYREIGRMGGKASQRSKRRDESPPT